MKKTPFSCMPTIALLQSLLSNAMQVYAEEISDPKVINDEIGGGSANHNYNLRKKSITEVLPATDNINRSIAVLSGEVFKNAVDHGTVCTYNFSREALILERKYKTSVDVSGGSDVELVWIYNDSDHFGVVTRRWYFSDMSVVMDTELLLLKFIMPTVMPVIVIIEFWLISQTMIPKAAISYVYRD